MVRYFNTAGPCIPGVHYMIPPEGRLTEARRLIEEGLFFVVHAPRQTGKTTLLNKMAAALNQEGRFTALVSSVEHLRRTTDVDKGNLSFIRGLHRDSDTFLPVGEKAPDPSPFDNNPLRAVHDYLRAWAASNPKPLVIFFDEIDSLLEDLLLSILGQLRMGYTARPAPFPHSVALVGLRDVRDYRIRLRPERESMGTSSPFNIKSDSLTLYNFTRDEVAELYGQHTQDTGQVFAPDAIDRIYEQTQGQPWLVNALARQITRSDVTDRTQSIQPVHVNAAQEALILRRDTHLDSLADKLHEERVRRVIEPILAGVMMTADAMNDDVLYVRDLGLIVDKPSVRIANPIYQEVIPRSLTSVLQVNITHESAWYTLADGSLDMPRLLRAFQEFFAENSEAWLARFDYQEAGPHLVLMAFLQRIVNSGGTIRREFAVGSGRSDLVVEWKGHRYAMELKVRRGDRTEQQGIDQLSRYLDRLRLDTGYLILFDQRKTVSWDEKIYEKQVTGSGGQKILVFGA